MSNQNATSQTIYPGQAPIKAPNAYLQFWDSNTGQYVRRNIWVDKIEQAHTMSGSTAQTLWFQHFYPKSYAPGPVKVSGRVPTQAHYDRLADHIRMHHGLLAEERGNSTIKGTNDSDTYHLNLMKLEVLKNIQPPEYYAKEQFTVWGWVISFPAGAKRFNPAPPFTFDFEVILDRHSKNTTPDLVSKEYNASQWFMDVFTFNQVFPDEVELGFSDSTPSVAGDGNLPPDSQPGGHGGV